MSLNQDSSTYSLFAENEISIRLSEIKTNSTDMENNVSTLADQSSVLNPLSRETRIRANSVRVSEVTKQFNRSVILDLARRQIDPTHIAILLVLNLINTVVQLAVIPYVDYSWFDLTLVISIVMANWANMAAVAYLKIDFIEGTYKLFSLFVLFLGLNLGIFTSWGKNYQIYTVVFPEVAIFLLLSYIEASVVTIYLGAREALLECITSTSAKFVHEGDRVEYFSIENQEEAFARILLKNFQRLDQNRLYLAFKIVIYLPLLVVAILVSFYELFGQSDLVSDASLSFCCVILTITSVSIMAASSFNKNIFKIEAMNNVITGLAIEIFYVVVDERWYISVLSLIFTSVAKVVRDEGLNV